MMDNIIPSTGYRITGSFDRPVKMVEAGPFAVIIRPHHYPVPVEKK
jgi:hypothetical protein